MDRLTSHEISDLMEAYNAVYAPKEEVVEEVVEEDVEQLMERGAPTDPKAKAAYNANVAKNRAALGNALGRLGNRIMTGNPEGTRTPIRQTPNRRGGGTNKPASPKPAGVDAKVAPATKPSGVSGLSAADRAAYSAGGGNAKAMQGMGQSTAQVIAQGKANLARMDQGKPAPAGARPTSGPSSTNPKSGLSAGPAARPAAATPPAAKPTTPAAKPTTTYAGAQGVKPVGKPVPANAVKQVSGAPAQNATVSAPEKTNILGNKASELAALQAKAKADTLAKKQTAQRPMGARERMLNQSFDAFDVIKGHLLDEGYADTEEAALAIMANMSEEWRNEIVESSCGGGHSKPKKKKKSGY